MKKRLSVLTILLSFCLLFTSCSLVDKVLGSVINDDNHFESVDNSIDKLLEEYGYSESFKDTLKYAFDNFTYDRNNSLDYELNRLSEYINEVDILIENREKIPDEVIKSILNNPENFIYALGYVKASDVTNKVGYYEFKYKTPYLMQTDPRWAYFQYGNKDLGLTGCGPTVLSMVSISIKNDKSLTPDYIANLSMEEGYFVENVGSSWKIMTDLPDKLGFTSRELPLDINTIMKELDKGNLVVFSVGKGHFTKSGHFILVTGYESEGLHIMDPNSWINSEKVWGFSTIKDEIKNIWVFE